MRMYLGVNEWVLKLEYMFRHPTWWIDIKGFWTPGEKVWYNMSGPEKIRPIDIIVEVYATQTPT